MVRMDGVLVYQVDSPRKDAMVGERRTMRDLEQEAQQSGGAVELPS